MGHECFIGVGGTVVGLFLAYRIWDLLLYLTSTRGAGTGNRQRGTSSQEFVTQELPANPDEKKRDSGHMGPGVEVSDGKGGWLDNQDRRC